MRTNRPALCDARWIIPDTESVDALIDAVLVEQAWLVAVATRKYAHGEMVWAEGAGRPNRRQRKQGVISDHPSAFSERNY